MLTIKALLEVHVSVAFPPVVMLAGEALKVTEGGIGVVATKPTQPVRILIAKLRATRIKTSRELLRTLFVMFVLGQFKWELLC
jgi:hypothetical protein